MIHNDTTVTTNQQSSFTGGNHPVILLVAPSHDNLTEYTSKLLENFPGLGAPTLLCKIESPLTYDKLLSQKSIDPLATNVALIFCGHGEKNSLLGPGAQRSAPDYRTAHSSFFDESHVPIVPKFLLAFCSDTAAELGKSYDYMTKGRTFVGFDSESGFVLKGGVYADWWRRIIHGVASAMLSAPDIPALEKTVLDLYKEALSFFSTEKGREFEWGLMMRMYLHKQMEAMKFIRT